MDSYNKGNAFYVDEKYEEAAEKYTLAEQELPEYAHLFSSRAAAYLKLKKFYQALQDCNTAVRLQPTMEIVHYRKGLVCFELEEFETAKKSFETCLTFQKSTQDPSLFNRWIRKCEVEIEELDGDDSSKKQEIPPKRNTKTEDTKEAQKTDNAVEEVPKTSSSIMPVNPIKYQYYQSAESMSISILVKALDPEEAQITIESDHLRVVCRGEVVIDKQLHSLVNLEKSKYEIRKTKVEILLYKVEASIWPSIEGDGAAKLKTIKSEIVTPVTTEGGVPPPKRNTAYASHKDWDAVGSEISKELDAEKPEGEEALQKLFKDIYSKADSATQRAMNKSFQTSGGTVLSTNWGEVSQKDYEQERQAPKGVEWKNWEGKRLKQVEDN